MDKPIKIAVIGPRGFPGVQGGIERFSENLYPLLVGKGYDVTTFAIKRYCSHKEWKGVKFVYVPTSSSKTLEKFLYNFYTAIYCIFKRPDIVHVHSIASGFFIFLLKLFGIKVLARYNSRDYLHAKWSRLGKFILKFSEKQFLNADYIITNNKSYLVFLQSLGRNKNLSFVPNGIVIQDKEKYAQGFDAAFAHKLEKNKYILYVGRVTEEKNIQLLLEAFMLVGLSDLKLAIAGEAAHQDNYFESLKINYSDRRIIFLGKMEREKLNYLYANCALFVIPSLHEGMPNVLLEAMSFNCKILASRIAAHEQFEFDADTYFDTSNSTELKQKMLNKLNSLAIEDYKSMLSSYSWEHIVTQLHEIQLKVLNRKSNV